MRDADRPRPRICCYTSFTYSYLARARVLARSLRMFHPDWELHALIIDVAPHNFNTAALLADFDQVIHAHELGFHRFRAWIFKHDIVEACTAVKGQMLVHLLERGADKVIYFDPDIVLFSPISDIIKQLDQASIVITPHQLAPNESDLAMHDNELGSLRYGAFNLGFVAVANDTNGRDLASWWARQLSRACYDDVTNGIFTDQKYFDLVPGLFEGVYVNRDPGCNVASWNLSRRILTFDEHGVILVNGVPLKFYHFTKVGGAGDVMTERYAVSNDEVFEIWNWYKKQIDDHLCSDLSKKTWHYNNFSNGLPIPKPARIMFRSRVDLYTYFEDPFEADGNESYYRWLLHEAPDLLMTDQAAPL